MRINIETIPHENQRYKTVGDWKFEEPEKVSIPEQDEIILNVKVSELYHDDPITKNYMECLVGIHEVIEALLCKANGISDEIVTAFDIENIDNPDPGSIPVCPYYRQHLVASMIERMIAHELQIDWEDYEITLEEL